jgi:arginyl-tRNA synthetase
VLVKSSGEPTYLLPDVAYHRGSAAASTASWTMGADHVDQVPFVRAAIALWASTPSGSSW